MVMLATVVVAVPLYGSFQNLKLQKSWRDESKKKKCASLASGAVYTILLYEFPCCINLKKIINTV